jgi:hypothetical protein
MRRETKAGLVVTCSFLALLGVVLFSKYRQIDLDRAAGLLATASGAEGEPAVSAPAGTAPASLAAALGIGTKPPSGIVQTGHQEMQPVAGGRCRSVRRRRGIKTRLRGGIANAAGPIHRPSLGRTRPTLTTRSSGRGR